MTSDRGSQFTTALWTYVPQSLSIQLHRTTSYHSQSNRLVKRFKMYIKAQLVDSNWTEVLPWVLLGLRTAQKKSWTSILWTIICTGKCISSDSLPCVSLDTQKHHKLPPLIPTSAHTAAKSFVPDDILRTKYVFVRRDARRGPLQRPYDGPYKVKLKRWQVVPGANRQQRRTYFYWTSQTCSSELIKSSTSCSTSTAT